MASKEYILFGSSKWMGLSGNALLALTNKTGSGKKISVTDVSIFNKTILGKNFATDTINPLPSRIKVMPVTAVSGGTDVTLVKMDSSQANFPATVNVKTDTNYTPVYIQSHPNTSTYTDATVVVGDTVFTPGSAPGWIANEHRDYERWFVVASGGNAGRYRILSNTTTALTLDRGLISATSTSGYIAEEKEIIHTGMIKTYLPSIANPGYQNLGTIHGDTMPFGSIFTRAFNSNLEPIVIRANESIVVGFGYAQMNNPLFIEGTLVVEGTPDKTYTFSYYSYMSGNDQALLSIENTTGSGEVVYLTELAISEIGTTDTPYFQLVPISGIDPVGSADTDKKLTPEPFDSAFGSLSTSIAEFYTNVPVYASGVPSSYLAESSVGSPKGFNYLNTKDFIGPVYATYFPEAAAYKYPDTFYTAMQNGTLGSHISDTLGTIKCSFNPIAVREGEGLAIVSGAETATGTTSVGISGWGAYDFSITVSVTNATAPTLYLTGLASGSEVRVLNAGTNTEVAGNDNVTSGTFSWQYDQDVYSSVDIHVHHVEYLFIRLTTIALGNNDVTIPIQQTTDRQYARGTIFDP